MKRQPTSDGMPDLSRPLFEEVPDELDETWTWGVLTGGMAWKEGALPAREFLTAANLLVDRALAHGDTAPDLRNPILFLYRHAIELALKDAVQTYKPTHGLTELIEALERKHGASLDPTVRARLDEWVMHDPASTAYRYGKAPAGVPAEERWIDLRHLREVMDFLVTRLRELG